jgi:hypothetical protein
MKKKNRRKRLADWMDALADCASAEPKKAGRDAMNFTKLLLPVVNGPRF